MRIGTVQHEGIARSIIETNDSEVLLSDAGGPDLKTLAGLDEDHLQAWAHSVRRYGQRLAPADLSWLPPVERPGKILCVALNNSANPDRIFSGPDTPAMFVKPATSLVGHGQAIRLRDGDGRVHPEPELAVVIGKTAKDVEASAALSHVFGYTILNDITAPDLRAEDTFHYRAIHPDPDSVDGIRHVASWVSYPGRYKGSDTFAPLGPWVVSADSIPDPHSLRVTCSYDGRAVTDDSTANLRFSVADVISFASRYLTLEPGDIIGMGTALRATSSGGAVQNVNLRHGGLVEVTIDGVGSLSNPVVRK